MSTRGTPVVWEIQDKEYKIVPHPLCAKSRSVTATVLCFAESFSLFDRRSIDAPNGVIEVVCTQIRPATEPERTPFLPHDYIAVFIAET
jgi:hypothetical protein